MTSTCPTCGEQFTPRPQHGDRPRQRFCTFDCWKAHSRSHYDEMLTLIQLGETPRSAAERVGVSVVAAERWFRRHGHLNLARMFARARKSGAYA